jgi:hypothetical protein
LLIALVLPLEPAAWHSDVAETGVGVRTSRLNVSEDGLEGFDHRSDALDPERYDVADPSALLMRRFPANWHSVE